MSENHSISIIGSGNVGRRIGDDFIKKGNNVIFYDVVEEVVYKMKESGCNATLDMDYAIRNSDISFVAVPTPVNESGLYDCSYLKNAAANIGSALKKKDSYHVVVLKSTVVPGTTEGVFIPEIERNSEKQEGDGFGVVYNPEFLTVIQKTWTDNKDFCISPGKEGRIVLGEGKSKKSGDAIEKLLKEEDGKTPILRTDYKTAELTKLVANNRLSLAISYSNEVFLFIEELNKKGMEIDPDFVMKAVAMDARIGPYGSVCGMAWGGPCFKKDTTALKTFFKNETGKIPEIISASIGVNNEMKRKYGVRE